MVYSREQDDDVLTFLHSGKLWQDALVLVDEESGSLWSQATGEAIAGEKTGRVLASIPSVMTTWERWLAGHPDTLVLPSDHQRRRLKMRLYPRMEGMLGILGTDNPDPRLAGKTVIAGFNGAADPVAVHFPAGNDAQAAQLHIDGAAVIVEKAGNDGPIRVWRSSGPPAWRKIEQIPAATMYWFVWSALNPGSEIVAAQARPREAAPK